MRKHILQTDPKFVRRYRSFPIAWYPRSDSVQQSFLLNSYMHRRTPSANSSRSWRWYIVSTAKAQETFATFAQCFMSGNTKMPRYAEWSLSKYAERLSKYSLSYSICLSSTQNSASCCKVQFHVVASFTKHRFCLSKIPLKFTRQSWFASCGPNSGTRCRAIAARGFMRGRRVRREDLMSRMVAPFW